MTSLSNGHCVRTRYKYSWGHSIQVMGGNIVIGRSIHGVVIIDGSLYSRFYGIVIGVRLFKLFLRKVFVGKVSVKKVTNVRTIANAIEKCDIYKGMLSEIYFTFPVTSATAERIFSSLRRIESYLRDSMSHTAGYLFMLYVHSSKTDYTLY